ncbi:hypothetical protein M8C21_029123, partial [Ambrosia artemisiifolia]
DNFKDLTLSPSTPSTHTTPLFTPSINWFSYKTTGSPPPTSIHQHLQLPSPYRSPFVVDEVACRRIWPIKIFGSSDLFTLDLYSYLFRSMDDVKVIL